MKMHSVWRKPWHT